MLTTVSQTSSMGPFSSSISKPEPKVLGPNIKLFINVFKSLESELLKQPSTVSFIELNAKSIEPLSQSPFAHLIERSIHISTIAVIQINSGIYYYDGHRLESYIQTNSLDKLHEEPISEVVYYSNSEENPSIFSFLQKRPIKGHTSINEFVKNYLQATAGCSDAQFNLGIHYNIGMGIKKDYIKAKKWFKEAELTGNCFAISKKGVDYFEKFQASIHPVENCKLALNCFQIAGEDGDAISQRHLGLYYMQGLAKVEQDYVKAFEWFRKGAEGGDSVSMRYLGAFYLNGLGVEKCEKTAIVWFKEAANANDPLAQVNLGICFQGGIGVEKDSKTAFELYNQACEEGHFPEALFQVGLCYENGIGVKKNSRIARENFKKADENNSSLIKPNNIIGNALKAKLTKSE